MCLCGETDRVKTRVHSVSVNLEAAESSPSLFVLVGFPPDSTLSPQRWSEGECVFNCICFVCWQTPAWNTTQTFMAAIKRHVILMERTNLANTHTHTHRAVPLWRHSIWIYGEMCGKESPKFPKFSTSLKTGAQTYPTACPSLKFFKQNFQPKLNL